MTDKEIKVQKALGTYLSIKWKERKKLYAKADKLYAEGYKLQTGDDKLYTEGDKLRIEADKLQAKGDELYTNAVIEVYGLKAVIDWDNGSVKND